MAFGFEYGQLKCFTISEIKQVLPFHPQSMSTVDEIKRN